MWLMTVKILRDVALVSVFITLLLALGNGLNYVIPWQWLTYMFSILKFFSSQISFMWDVTSMWTVVSMVLGLEIIFWSFTAGTTVIKWFKN